MTIFGNEAFAQLLREIEIEYHGIQGSDDADKPAESSTYIQAAEKHDMLFREAITRAEAIIAARIRSDWMEFVAPQEE